MKQSTFSFSAVFVLSLALLGAGCGTSTRVGAPSENRPVPGSATAPTAQPPQPNQPVGEAPTPLPSNVPSDIPTAPNSMIINTSVSEDQKTVKILLSSPDRSDRVLASLTTQLTRNGFSQISDSTAANTRTVIFKKNSLTMGVTLIQEIDVTNYEVSREE